METVHSKGEKLWRMALVAALGGSFSFLYLPLITNWFFSDDIHWIWASASHQVREIFFVPERARAMASNFTPFLGLSFKIDWVLFGMNPEGYAVHSLLTLCAAAAALYFFLRLYVAAKTALVGLLLFLLNPITLSITSWFSTRHYIEGLFWALLSLYFFVRGERAGKVSLSAGIFYLLASLNKEVYVVLPAVALLLPGEGLLKRLRNTLPLWTGLVVYALWRTWIMGGIGGYPSNQPFGLSEMLRSIPKIISFLGLHWFGAFAPLMYVLLSLLLVAAVRNPRAPLFFLVLLIPLFPVANIIGEGHLGGRYFFHLTVFLICTLCLCMESKPIRGSRLYGGGLLVLVLLVAALSVKRDLDLFPVIKSQSLTAKEAALAFVKSEKKYLESRQPSWFYEGLRKINRDFLGREITTQLVPPSEFIKYSAPEKLRDIEASGISVKYAEIARDQERFKRGPLTVRITLDGYRLTWDFGPRKDATYTLLRSQVSGLYYNSSELRPTGTYMLSKGGRNDAPGTAYIRVFYRSQEGDEVLSPEFTLQIPSVQKIEYSE